VEEYCALTDFKVMRPKYEIKQEDGIAWLVNAHTKAEAKQKGFSNNEEQAFREEFLSRFMHIGCKPDNITKRGHELPDFLHTDWQQMQVYNLDSAQHGAGQQARQALHSSFTDAVFEKYYPAESHPPSHIIHVSCTGYASPSSAQTLISKRGWGNQTLVTHAYHMGCYASVPAIRMGAAFARQHSGDADIVHTELCTLHCNPANHDADQIVLQSLFADGYIKYTVRPEEEAQKAACPYMKVLGTHEYIIPESTDAMTWKLADWGFQGTLSKKIPVLIARHVKEFITHFCRQCGVNSEEILAQGIFAIHPGGPRILDHIQKVLALHEKQLLLSRAILREYGNISSATLPHIWEAILADQAVPKGVKVMSLAFGPGLNIAGALLEKR